VVVPAYNATTTLGEPLEALEALGAQQYEDDWGGDRGQRIDPATPRTWPGRAMYLSASRLVE
jgi:hypothetical protein